MTQSTVESIEGMVRQGLHPKEIAKVVIDAINDPKPKLRYIVGKDAGIITIVKADKKALNGIFQI